MDNAKPSLFSSVIVVDLKPESRLVKLLRRWISPAEEQAESPLLEGLNETDFDRLMALLDAEKDELDRP